jgi:hypothetical protein
MLARRKNKMVSQKMKLLSNSLCLLLLLSLNHAYAQQAETAPALEETINEEAINEEATNEKTSDGLDNDEATNSVQQKAPSAVTTQAVPPAKRADENRVFKPSEKISADIAVPFPVDI